MTDSSGKLPSGGSKRSPTRRRTSAGATDGSLAEALVLRALGADNPAAGLLFEELLAGAPPMYVCDDRPNLVYASNLYHHLVALAGRTFGTLAARRVHFPLFDEVFNRLKRERGPVRSEDRIAIGNLTKHYVSRHIPVINDEGRIIGAYGVYSDATDLLSLRQSCEVDKERAREMLRSVADWVWEVDESFIVTDVSRGITAVTGLPPKLVKGLSLMELGEFVESEGGARSAREVLAAHAAFRSLIFSIRDTENQLRRFKLTGVPVFHDKDESFAGYRGTATDVTNRYKSEEHARHSRQELERAMAELIARNRELGAANENARAAVEAKNSFLAMVSHELRTPLNAIIGFAEVSSLQMFGPLPEPYLGYCKDIHSAARHLLGLINDLLDLARIESDKLEVHPQRVSLSNLVTDTAALIVMESKQKGVDMSAVRVPEDHMLWADPVRARQVLVNLLSNAVKFTDRGGSIGVSIARSVPGMLDVTVWDTGIGIPQEKHETVFETFQQLGDEIERRQRVGTGLGLAISRRLARLMGGDILLDSAPGKGSRFTVRLPLAGAAGPASAEPGTASDAAE